MKRILLGLLCFFVVTSCTHTANWTPQQKDEFKEHIKAVRGLAYANNMTVEEFEKYANDVAASVQSTYPDYSVFMNMPGVEDTIAVFAVTQFAYDVDSDYRNLRNLYPYHQLVKDGVLPEGVTKEAKEAFYACLAAKIRGEYESIGFFLGALSFNDKANQQAIIFQQQCAMELGASIMIEEQITQ